jgi:predicted AAA+ superfamily ATPase
MNYISRDIEKTIKKAAESYAAIVITGPRQVGKTTALREIAKTEKTPRRYVTLDDLEARKLAATSPETFLAIYPPPVMIDEVQYAPELFSYIKIAVDNGAPPASFFLTGSQSFRLSKLSNESLAGRAAVFHMPSLSQNEIFGGGKIGENGGGKNEEFVGNKNRKNAEEQSGGLPFSVSLESFQERLLWRTPVRINEMFERIWRGSLPGFISGKFPDRDIFYSSYVSTYINRDIGDMSPGTDSFGFSDFIRAAACRIGQILNIHDIAADVGVTDETAKRWLSLLERSGVVYYLRPYSNNLLKRTISKPKLYFFDTGLVAFLTKYSSPEILQNGALAGAIFENYVISEILKSYQNNGAEAVMHYYRDRDGKEIDLILESDGALHPIEIKKTVSPSGSAAKAFSVLDKASVPRGAGAIICTKNELSAANEKIFILPVWAV